MKMSLCHVGMLALALLSAACASRQHMSESYGESSKRFFEKQHVNASAAQGSPSGLDSEESALIQSSYTQSLGKDAQQRSQDPTSRVMLLKDSQSDNDKGP